MGRHSPHICVCELIAKLYAHLLVTYQFFVCCRRRSAIKESKAERKGESGTPLPHPITFQHFLVPERKPFIFFLLNYAFDSVSSGQSLSVTHLWLQCDEGLIICKLL